MKVWAWHNWLLALFFPVCVILGFFSNAVVGKGGLNLCIAFKYKIATWPDSSKWLCVFSAAYADNSSACLSMLQSHDNWSSLGVTTHTAMLPMGHSTGTATSSR